MPTPLIAQTHRKKKVETSPRTKPRKRFSLPCIGPIIFLRAASWNRFVARNHVITRIKRSTVVGYQFNFRISSGELLHRCRGEAAVGGRGTSGRRRNSGPLAKLLGVGRVSLARPAPSFSSSIGRKTASRIILWSHRENGLSDRVYGVLCREILGTKRGWMMRKNGTNRNSSSFSKDRWFRSMMKREVIYQRGWKSTLRSFLIFEFSIHLSRTPCILASSRSVRVIFDETWRHGTGWTVYIFVRYRDEEFRQFIRDLVGQITRWFSDLTNMKYWLARSHAKIMAT